jgi:thymidylate synthase
MMKSVIIEEESVANAAKKAIDAVWKHGINVERTVGKWCMMKPGRASLRELHNVMITIRDPVKRWNSRVNGSLVTETLDYLLGLNPGYTHKTKWKFYAQWINKETGKYPYTYGERIFGHNDEINQWNQVVRLLKGDRTTRHAHITIYRPEDLHHEFVPCNVAWHFQIDARSKLNMVTFCRSQDALRGLLLDAFAYTHFFEQLALATGLQMGSYTIFEANLHVYEKDASKIGTGFAQPSEPYSNGAHPGGAQLLNEGIKKELNRLLQKIFEKRKLSRIHRTNLPTYWKDCIYFIAAEMLMWSKMKRRSMIKEIENEDILWALKTNLSKIGVEF